MALAFSVPTLDDLAPEVQALYVPDPTHGGFVLDVDTPDAIKTALAAERDARKTAERIARAAEARAKAAEKVDEIAAERDRAVAAAAALRRSVLEAQVREAARVAELHPPAIPDAVRAAKELFDIGDDGALKAKNGKTTVEEWLAARRDDCPHWFPATGRGSGSNPAAVRSTGRDSNTMTRRAFDALPAAQKAALARSGSITITD